MKFKKLIMTILVITLIFAATGCSSKTEMVAKVNDSGVSAEIFSDYFALYKYSSGYDENTWTIDVEGKTFLQVKKEEILEELINAKVIELYLNSNDLVLTEADIQADYDQYMEMLNSNEEIKLYLTEQGISDDFFKKLIFSSTYLSEFQKQVVEATDVSEEALMNYYETNKEKYILSEVRASHILVKTEEEAQTLLTKLGNGEKFEDLAKTFSIGPSSVKGGDLGYFTRNMMIKSFSDAAFELEIDEISNIVQTEHGYHIIKVTDKKEEVKTFEESKIMVENNILMDSYQEKLETIKKDYKIEKYVDNM